jgi:hypothetical protein
VRWRMARSIGLSWQANVRAKAKEVLEGARTREG